MSVKLGVRQKEWAARAPFRTAHGVWNSVPTVVVTLRDGDLVGRGESRGVSYLGETLASVVDEVESVRAQIEAGADRAALLTLLRRGGARNALDCALWDLEAKRSGKRVWELAGIDLRTITTAYSIGIEDEPDAMAGKAAEAAHQPLLKVKLDADRPVERIQVIRNARPDARIVIDANQSWSLEQLQDVAPRLRELNVEMIEQPLPRGADEGLETFTSPVPLCADESCLGASDLEPASRRYQTINIKLDKCGGLTHGLETARKARKSGLGLMVGCMGGTSLAMAPAFVLGLLCDLNDLDGPLLLRRDCNFGLKFDQGVVEPPSVKLWG